MTKFRSSCAHLNYQRLESREVLSANLPVTAFVNADNVLFIRADPASTETIVRVTDSATSSNAVEVHNCEFNASSELVCPTSTVVDVTGVTELLYVGNDFVDNVDVAISQSFPLTLVGNGGNDILSKSCLLYTSPSPRDGLLSRMPSSA